MRKVITLRFASKCKVCTKTIPAGERANWLGQKAGVTHLTCSDAKPSPLPAEDDKSEGYKFAMPFSALRESYRRLTESNDVSHFNLSHSRATARRLREEVWIEMAEWVGCTISQVQEWLANGFTVEGLAGIDPSLIPAKPKRRLRYAEEGDEMLIDLVMMGVDEHFVTVDRKPGKPGLRVEIMMAFSSSVDPQLVIEYERFAARMLQTFDEHHIDVEIDLINQTTKLSRESNENVWTTAIRVKNAGEASDISSWSAMFSPGGFRQLVFLSKIHHCDAIGHSINFHLGYPVTTSFDVLYNEETNTLRLTNANGGTFPEYEMTQKLQRVIETVSG